MTGEQEVEHLKFLKQRLLFMSNFCNNGNDKKYLKAREIISNILEGSK